MAKRTKPVLNVPTITNLEEADAMLARITARKRELTLIDLGLKEDVDRLKTQAAAQCEPVKEDIGNMEQAITRFCMVNREEMFTKKKSVDLTFGTIGFRSSSTLKTMKKITWDMVLGMLESANRTGCIRLKKEVDKEAMRKLPLDELSKFGCKLEQEDAFFYETNETDVLTQSE